ncbi:MAG: histidinol dehydrogenase [Nitrospinaceae bacterium]
MKIYKYNESGFDSMVDALVDRWDVELSGKDGMVRQILQDVKRAGDNALLEYTHRFDRNTFSLEELRVRPEDIRDAYTQVRPEELEALKTAAANIRKYHEKQLQESWDYREGEVLLGQIIRPLETVGIYVPGGKASYPSSVLMNAIPARVAGVDRIIMCSPAPGGTARPHVLVAADLAGVTEIFKVGGAQAVAAMAYGTAALPRVDKIVGPGNIFVAIAKRMVYGIVDIDMIAGPSEILIIADGSARAEFVAADLLSQAEHDEQAVPILVTPSENLVQEVVNELEKQKQSLPRRAIIEASLETQCRLLVTAGLDEAVELANRIAPEHLELAVEDAESWVGRIKNAGAIFLGHFTPEALGDYVAGPNHVLPTSGTARFSSPLGVYDFIKRTSLIGFSRGELEKYRESVVALAGMEGLEAHANAVKIRVGPEPG